MRRKSWQDSIMVAAFEFCREFPATGSGSGSGREQGAPYHENERDKFRELTQRESKNNDDDHEGARAATSFEEF